MAKYKGSTLRQDLQDLLVESPMETIKFMGDIVLPPISVRTTSANIPVLSTSAGMKSLDLKRGRRGTFERGEWVWSSDSYNTYEYGYEEPVDLTEALEHSEIFNEEFVAAQIAQSQLKIAREARVAAAVFNVTTFAAAADSYTVTQEWDDATNADPYLNITQAYADLKTKTGVARSACHLLINDVVFRNIMRADRVRNDIKYTITLDTMPIEQKQQVLADFLGIKKIDVATSFYDTTKIGIEAGEFSDLWSNEYGMLYLPCPTINSWRVKGLGRQPVWSKYSPDYVVESYSEEQTRSTIVRCREYRGEKVNKTFGVLMDNMTT